MKRKQTIQCLLVLLLVVASILVFTSFLHTTDDEVTININSKSGEKLNPIKHQVVEILHNQTNEVRSVYYRLSNNTRYRYEFRFEFSPSTKNDDHRLILILYGNEGSCATLWNSSVSSRTLAAIRSYNYSILAICSQQEPYDVSVPIQNNKDARYIYLSLQIWMNTVYYQRFKQYPRLYIHATSRGSKFAGILCRILPIQAQILYIYPGHSEAMVTPSDYDIDMQTRLILDPTFANWFYFDFCYNKKKTYAQNRTLCPFYTNKNYFYPLSPIFFINLKNDPYQNEEIYKNLIKDIRNQHINFEKTLLSHTETIQLDTLPSMELNISSIQEYFPIWNSNSHAAQLFLEYFTNPTRYRTTDPNVQTCWCSEIDFKYFEAKPHITMTWPKQKQNEYSNYVKDIRKFQPIFCDTICDNLISIISITPRNIHKTLAWFKRMDQLRELLYIDDYVNRPLRIWMYDKNLLVKNSIAYPSKLANWSNIDREYQMYSPEYYLQDYFQRLNRSKEIQRRYFEWAHNPLLADYFIISSDIMFFYFHPRPSSLNEIDFKKLHTKLNEDYFQSILTNIRTNFPYWTLSSRLDQIGANHILLIPGGRNMGILFNKTQYILKNVIQIGFTGIRQDLLPKSAPPPYVHRDIYITYRHHYDIIIPQSTPLNLNRTESDNIDILVKQKKRLFYFAGTLSHITSSEAARFHLSSLWEKMRAEGKSNMFIKIQEKQFNVMTIFNGHMKPHEYINAIQTSVFSLCPEGFLPWSPRLYEAIQIGAIPLLLVDNLILPFERFIDWRSFSAKINVTHIKNLTSIIDRIDNFEKYIKQKLTNVLPYLLAFRWPYSIIIENKRYNHTFQPEYDRNGQAKNAFHYLSLELRCRRLEQWYGLTVNTSTTKSKEAQRLACTNYPTICPCHNEQRLLAFQEYL